MRCLRHKPSWSPALIHLGILLRQLQASMVECCTMLTLQTRHVRAETGSSTGSPAATPLQCGSRCCKVNNLAAVLVERPGPRKGSSSTPCTKLITWRITARHTNGEGSAFPVAKTTCQTTGCYRLYCGVGRRVDVVARKGLHHTHPPVQQRASAMCSCVSTLQDGDRAGW